MGVVQYMEDQSGCGPVHGPSKGVWYSTWRFQVGVVQSVEDPSGCDPVQVLERVCSMKF